MKEEKLEVNAGATLATPPAEDSFSEKLRDLASENYWLYLEALIDGDADDESIIAAARHDLRLAAILPTPHAVATYLQWLHDEIGHRAEMLVVEIHEALFEAQRLAERALL